MRPLAITLVFASSLLFVAQVAPGQAVASAQTAPEPTIRANANLVLVDVVVTEHGRAVHGLDRTRFHIFEDGKEQPIASFDEHQPASAPPAFMAPAALPPGTYTNVPAYPESSAVNVLLLDALNTPIGNQMQVRDRMIDYLGTVKPGTALAIFTLSTRLNIVTQFTSDPAGLISLLKKSKTNPKQSPVLATEQAAAQLDNEVNAVGGAQPAIPPSILNTGEHTVGPMNAVQALEQFQADQGAFQVDLRMRITLDAMKELATYLGGIPGRKNVIWFSASFPLVLLPDAAQFDPFGALRSYRDDIQKATDMLAAARVAIYPVDARGLWGPTEFSAATNFAAPNQGQSTQWASAREQQYSEEATMQEVADETGGQAYLETNELDKAVASAIENGASYYTLAYVPENAALDGQYRKIQIRIDDDHGLKLAYRRGYYADVPGKSSPENAEQTSVFAAALAHDAPAATEILLKARVLPATDPAFRGVSLPSVPAGKQPAAFKGPAHRYIIDLTIDPRGLAFETMPDGDRKTAVELAMVAYDADGQRLNFFNHSFQVGLKAAQYERTLATGITVRLPFDLPAGPVDLRIGVHDLNADRAGSLDVPLHVAEK